MIYRRVFTGFLGVLSPPGNREKVVGGRTRGLFAGSDAVKSLTALRAGVPQNDIVPKLTMHSLSRNSVYDILFKPTGG